jgi:ectoine hydroxylase-related dioxygenase (phytanoyl-CoA dioxygenase family)
MLNDSQVQQFNRDGHLKGGQVLSAEQCAVLSEEMERVIRDKDNKSVPQPVSLALWGSGIWQIVNIWEGSTAFRELLSNDAIVNEIAQLTGAKQLRVWHDQIQYKPAGTGGVNSWHQDWPYWPTLTPMTEQVSAWIALDDVDEGNGCMSMVPGSHLWGNNIDFLHTIKEFDKMPSEFQGHKIEVKKAPVPRGFVHYHHGLTWHGSHENKSGRKRRAIAVHYMTEKTLFAKRSGHPMDQFAKVKEGAMLEGEHFPLVWSNGKRVAVPKIEDCVAATK